MKKLVGVLVLMLIGYAQYGFAGSDSGLYWGGSMGQASLSTGGPDFDVDEDSSGYKVILGYNFGWVPMFDFAIEADYRDFGSFETQVESDLVTVPDSFDLSSYDIYGLVGYNFGPMGIFGKLGFSNTDFETVVDNTSEGDSDSSNSWGLGAKIGLGGLAVRAEYEEFDLDAVDKISMTSLGVTLTF